MSKKEKILSILLCFVSFFLVDTLFVNALSTDGLIVPSSAQFYDNNNGSLTAKSTDLINNGGNDMFFMSDSFITIPGTSGGAVGFYLNEPLMSGYAYSLTVSVGATGCGYTNLSSVNRIGIGGSLNSSKNAYQNGGNSVIKFSDYSVSGNKGLSFVFVAGASGNYITLPFTMASRCTDVYYLYGYNITSLGLGDTLTSDKINTIINNNFNNISTTVKDSENNIKDSINDNFNDCEPEQNISFSVINGYDLIGDGNAEENSNWLITSYIPVKYGYSYTQSGFTSLFVETYDSNYKKISSLRQETFTITDSNVKYIRLNSKIEGYSGKIILNKKCTSKIDKTNEKIGEVNDTLNDDNTTDSTNKANEFFSGFTTETFGLTSIITAPLTLIGSITSSTCSPLALDIPFLSKNNKLTLPCMSSIYQENFGSFLTIYQTITFGIVAYWVCVRIFALVKEFKNPDEDRIEVLDL